MSTSFNDEQRDRLETLMNDLSVRNQQFDKHVPPSGLSSPLAQRALGGSAAPLSNSSLAECSGPPPLSNKGQQQ
jgi:hypothetical protein